MAQTEGGPQVSIIAWVPFGARSRELARGLGAPCHFISTQGLRHPLLAPLKYPLLMWKTWRLLRRERPRAIIVQNPPFPAVLYTALFCRLNRIALVIDTHSDALVGAKWAWSRPLQRRLSHWAAATLVHTKTLLPRLRGGARTLVLEDPPPSLPPARQVAKTRAPRVVVIGSFADDEPVAETLAAAAACPQMDFVLTGDASRLPNGSGRELPSNVTMPGWLSFQDYADLLRSATIILSLTTRDMTVLRGGWEAVYLGKPLVVSDWPALRDCFSAGAVYVRNTPEAIASGVTEALDRFDELTTGIERLRETKRAHWETGLARLRDLLAIAPPVAAPLEDGLSPELTRPEQTVLVP